MQQNAHSSSMGSRCFANISCSEVCCEFCVGGNWASVRWLCVSSSPDEEGLTVLAHSGVKALRGLPSLCIPRMDRAGQAMCT